MSESTGWSRNGCRNDVLSQKVVVSEIAGWSRNMCRNYMLSPEVVSEGLSEELSAGLSKMLSDGLREIRCEDQCIIEFCVNVVMEVGSEVQGM